MNTNLIFSNCLLEAIKFKVVNPKGRIRWDTNCPSGGVSFFFEIYQCRYRFRRKLRLRSNKSKILFYGYRVVEELNSDNKVVNTFLSPLGVYGYQIKQAKNLN